MFWWLIILSLFIVLIGIVISSILKKTNILRILELSKQFDGPPARFLIGNATLFILRTAAELYRSCLYVVNDFKTPSRIWVGNELVILLRDPLDCEKLLSSPKFIEKSFHYNFLKPWLNEGLLTSSGRKWFTRRKILTPAFHFKVLEQYVEIMNGCSKVFVNCMKKTFKPNEKSDILKLLSACALDIICEASMGVSINSMELQNSEYVKAVEDIKEIIQKRTFGPLLRYDFFFQFMKESRDQKKCLKILHGFTDNVITDRRNEINKNGIKIYNNNDPNDIGIKRKMVFLDILLQSTDENGKPLTNLDIREEVDTFMFEGHDTVTTALIFLFYNIAKHGDVQEKCLKEAQDLNLDNPNTPITINLLNQLHYMELAIKESLRLFPSVPSYGRKITEECEINGKIYPAGCNVLTAPCAMQRLERLYPKANEFIPERFLDNSKAKPNNPFAYIPFSAGPRNCIGQKFAMYELKSILLHTLLNFQIELDVDSIAEPEINPEMVMSPFKPIYFYIKPRI